MEKNMNDGLLCLIMTMVVTNFIHIKGEAFYPFANETNDLTLPRQDDAFTTIQLSFDLPFFGEVFREIHVSTNGIIFFGQGSTSYIPSPFPLNGTKCVAAYWVDSDPREGGDIFYREVFDPDLLTLISSDIKSRFINRANFRSTWAFIVTFHDVPLFGCRSSDVHPCTKVVKHQTILTSNGIESFVIFLYEKLGYSLAQIGFNAGDGKRYFMVPYSNTVNSSSYPLLESNVGNPGKWMFSITSEISGACNVKGVLEVYPKKLLYFGGQEISITGPCFESIQTTINVVIGQTNVNCSLAENLKILCIFPYIDFIGRVPLSLQHGSITYSSFIIAHDENDEVVNYKTMDVSSDDIEFPFVLSWNRSERTADSILLSGFQEDISIDDNGNLIGLNRHLVSINVPNTGMYEYLPNQIRLNKGNPSAMLSRIALTIGRRVYRKVIRTGLRFSCEIWHGLQLSASEMVEIVERESRRNPCQPTVPWNFPISLPGNFEMDAECHPSGINLCLFFHPGAKGCYRSTNNPNNIAVQCCYNNDNELLIGPPGGGTLDMTDSRKSQFGHFINDVLPYLLCCKFQSKCDKYYEKRPSVNSTFFVPPIVRRANGDPHFVTIDGTSYDFNPVGEFIYLQGPNLMVQTRISQYVNNFGVPQAASYFSAFAINISGFDTIMLELTAVKTIQVKVGTDILYSGMWRFENASVEIVNSSFVSFDTSFGFKMDVQVLSGMLHAIVLLSKNLKGKVFGLIGNWDDNGENDFMLPNKTFISLNSSNHDIHYLFGMEWATTENSSIFAYPVGLSWKDFQNKNFSPFFGTPPNDPRCNGDKDCSFDLHVTGDINISLSNIEIKEKAKNIESNLREISENCLLNVNISNGFVQIIYNQSDPTKVEYKIGCYSGYKLSGSEAANCTKGKYSHDFGACDKMPVGPSAGSFHKSELNLLALMIAFISTQLF